MTCKKTMEMPFSDEIGRDAVRERSDKAGDTIKMRAASGGKMTCFVWLGEAG